MARKRKRNEEQEPFDLCKKYRPKTLDEFLGNTSLKRTLKRAIEEHKVPHTIMIAGPRGSGKTTLGRIIANELNCSQLDFREIDVADFSGIDTSRQIRRTMATSPMKGKYKVFLLDEIALLGQGGASEKNKAQSALLKAFEEPPKHVFFIMCTTDPQNVLTTIRSRCVRYKVTPLPPNRIIELVTDIAKKEKAVLSKEVAKRISKYSQGIAREAIKMLEQVIFLSEEEQLEMTFSMDKIESNVKELCQCIWQGKSWAETASVLKRLKEEPESVRRKIRGYFCAILLNGNQKAFLILDSFQKPFFNTDAKNELVRCTYECWSELND